MTNIYPMAEGSFPMVFPKYFALTITYKDVIKCPRMTIFDMDKFFTHTFNSSYIKPEFTLRNRLHFHASMCINTLREYKDYTDWLKELRRKGRITSKPMLDNISIMNWNSYINKDVCKTETYLESLERYGEYDEDSDDDTITI